MCRGPRLAPQRRADEPIETVETQISVLCSRATAPRYAEEGGRLPVPRFVLMCEWRLEDCEREVALICRFAPDIYLGVRAVTGRDGEVIDHVVEMVRLPSEHRLGALPPHHIHPLSRAPVAGRVLTVDALDKRMRRERPFAPAPDRRDAASSNNG